MLDLKNKLQGVFMIIAGVALTVYGVISFGNSELNSVLPVALFLVTTGVGAISIGLSGVGAKGLGIPFLIATMALAVYCIYILVRALLHV